MLEFWIWSLKVDGGAGIRTLISRCHQIAPILEPAIIAGLYDTPVNTCFVGLFLKIAIAYAAG